MKVKGSFIILAIFLLLQNTLAVGGVIREADCPDLSPVLCSDGTCAKQYTECEGFEGCSSTAKPYLCSNGECAKNFYSCTDKYFQCERLQ